MDDDKNRRHGMYAIIAFNVAVLFFMILFTWLCGGMTYLNLFHFLGAIALGMLVAGATFGVAHVLEL